MNGPALFALFPEIPLPRAFALADVSPAPLSDALRFILSSSPGAQRCSPIVRSPEPGLLGAPSRGAGAGPGAWEPLTAASQRSRRSRHRRRRLPPWLRRRHLTTEVTHRPLLPAQAAAPPPPMAPPLALVHRPTALGLGTILTTGGSLQARGQIPIEDWFKVGSGPSSVKRLEAETLKGRY